MDKQKLIIIEEMIGIIQGAVGGCATHWASLIAEELVKYYQPKIPEGAVVLTRAEHQKYLAFKIIEPQVRGCLDRERELEKQLKQGEKEIAEKFAERLKAKLENEEMLTTMQEGIDPYTGKDGFIYGFERRETIALIDETAKEFTGGQE